MELHFAQAHPSRMRSSWAILIEAKTIMPQQGLAQWRNGLPNMAAVENDIAHGRAYLLYADGKPSGILALCGGNEPVCHPLYQGSWLTSGGYAAIHRVAVAAVFRGGSRGSQASAMLSKAAERPRPLALPAFG